ncbi:hypothetical protein FHX82_005151 [Amycolatopsis bartoniae]|uniref:PRC-barrel domain containing protein n=1 Tax=Amycolatopsis bartoniae TaxID=941986 RepID=A0A8H9IMN3_9PSEU|nr:hypothetical protein [Amycolatopsis bartoniae]MBB2938075.1 hypothetical protein [Amycolatopsis bartoniae]TVT09918.1 hypothetical protein FNH07_06605 [Amycolatopsis bartoniae]GHF32505.1 hypothetical protein GCM10017566_01330 [Amycolatopsis bartoniae]
MSEETIVTANDLLWDRQIFDRDGTEAGKVDDIELTTPQDGGNPTVTALLCGPVALGPRIGDRLGTWWTAIGRRLRPRDSPEPHRIPLDLVTRFDRHEVRVRATAAELPNQRMRDWTRHTIVEHLPGSR